MEAKDYAYEIVSQLAYGGKLDERITTETAQQIIETALNNYAELRLSNVVGRSEQFYCTCSRAKGLDHDDEGMPYCIECQKPVQ